VYRQRGARLTWDQVTDPLEVPDLNPHPPFAEWVRGRRISATHRAAGHAALQEQWVCHAASLRKDDRALSGDVHDL